ncbi:MAG: epimerase [Chitinophagales bacterium]|nr:epimerase [Chitinophagales bacterium]
MNVIITGSTGMVGKGVLFECLDSDLVQNVLVVNRRPLGIEHAKLKEILVPDFLSIGGDASLQFSDYDACFFCMGVSAFGLSEEEYRRITYDMTINFARIFHSVNPNAQFIYVTGEGTDSSESGNIMWARVKGKTENDILSMGFKHAYMFRPGYIQPMRGIKSKTKLYNSLYVVAKPLFPIIKALAGDKVTTTEAVGKAMINAVRFGYSENIIHSKDINELASLKNH